MAKYKQKVVPETSYFTAKSMKLSEAVKEFYKNNLQGKTIVNKHIGISICFTSDGLGKVTQHRKIGQINAAAIKIIDKMLENAEYSNFGQRKETDKQNIIGYLNFKATAIIEGEKRHFRISLKLKTDMKAYYNHTVNRYKGDEI